MFNVYRVFAVICFLFLFQVTHINAAGPKKGANIDSEPLFTIIKSLKVNTNTSAKILETGHFTSIFLDDYIAELRKQYSLFTVTETIDTASKPNLKILDVLSINALKPDTLIANRTFVIKIDKQNNQSTLELFKLTFFKAKHAKQFQDKLNLESNVTIQNVPATALSNLTGKSIELFIATDVSSNAFLHLKKEYSK